MSNLIPFNQSKRRIKGHPTKDEILDGHFEDVLDHYRNPLSAVGLGLILGIVVIGTGLPWLLAFLMGG